MLASYWQKCSCSYDDHRKIQHTTILPNTSSSLICMNLNFSTCSTSQSGLLIRLYNGTQVVCRVILFFSFCRVMYMKLIYNNGPTLPPFFFFFICRNVQEGSHIQWYSLCQIIQRVVRRIWPGLHRHPRNMLEFVLPYDNQRVGIGYSQFRGLVHRAIRYPHRYPNTDVVSICMDMMKNALDEGGHSQFRGVVLRAYQYPRRYPGSW